MIYIVNTFFVTDTSTIFDQKRGNGLLLTASKKIFMGKIILYVQHMIHLQYSHDEFGV